MGSRTARASGRWAWFPGLLDEIRVWDHARKQGDIREGLARRLTGTEAGLVGYWRCDESGGATVRDSSGRGHEATLIGEVGRVASDIWQHFPLVATQGVRDMGPTFATVEGWVHTGGFPTSAFLEWGRTTEYGNATCDAGNPRRRRLLRGDGRALDLDPGATYHYRLVTRSASGTSVGADRTFDTSGTGGGQAVALYGEQAFLLTGDLTRSFRDETLTIELWFKATAAGTLINEVGQFPHERGWRLPLLELLPNGELWARVQDLKAVRLGIAEFDRWHHVVLRYDKTSLRLDGFLDGTAAESVATGDRQAPWEAGHQAWLGFGLNTDGRLPGTTGGVQGMLDEIRVWNRTLSGPELEANARLPLSGLEPGLVAYWRCDEEIGMRLADASGNGNVATLWPGGQVVGFERSRECVGCRHARRHSGHRLFRGAPRAGASGRLDDRGLVRVGPNPDAGPRDRDPGPAGQPGPRDGQRATRRTGHREPVLLRAGGEGGPASRCEATCGTLTPRVAMLGKRSAWMGPTTTFSPGICARLFPTDSLTIELWFKAEGSGVLVDERDQPPPQSGWLLTLLEVLPTGEVRARVHQVAAVSLGQATFGEWHHVALRYDHEAQRLDGFLDGLPAAAAQHGGPLLAGGGGIGCPLRVRPG